MKRSKYAFVTIEILVAMVIGFLAVFMVMSSSKMLMKTRMQKDNYERLYITALSLKDRIKAEGCRGNSPFQGELNGFVYKAVCKEKKMLRNYVTDPQGVSTGNYGNYRMYFYEIGLEIRQNSFVKAYTFDQTEQE